MKSYNCKWKLVGLVSLGEENRSMQAIIKGQYMSKYFSIIYKQLVLASEVHKILTFLLFLSTKILQLTYNVIIC